MRQRLQNQTTFVMEREGYFLLDGKQCPKKIPAGAGIFL
jgi:hypothetical protein